MKFKRLKYYSVVGMLIVMIAVCFGFTTFMVEKPVNSSDGNETVNPPDDTGPDYDGEEVDQSNIPPITKPFALLDYALDIHVNGKGFTSTYYTEAVSNVLGVKGTQFIKTYRQRCGDVNVETDYVMADTLGDNFARVIYQDTSKKENQVKVLKTEKYDYYNQTASWEEGMIENINTAEEFTAKYNMILNNFPVTINPKTSKCTSARISGKNYLLVFDVSEFTEMYENSYSSASKSVNWVKMKNIRVTFTINRATGYLVKIQRQESYVLNGTKLGITTQIDVNSTTTETFTSMNKEIENIIIPDILK